jgi:hypothetical protein
MGRHLNIVYIRGRHSEAENRSPMMHTAFARAAIATVDLMPCRKRFARFSEN